MFEQLDQDQLGFLQVRIRRLIGNIHTLEQAKREERGAYVRSELSVPTYQFEQSLLRSYRNLFEEVIASLRGRNDDLAMGRLHQDTDSVPEVEVVESMDYWDVPLDEREHGIDKTRLAAILTLLLLWRSRHTERAKNYLNDFFLKGRTGALKEIKLDLVISPETIRLKETILGRYAADLDRLEIALRDGSPRSRGLQWIVENSRNLGEALALLRRLRDSEQLRVRMFAESLAWTAWVEGYRAGAVEGTREIAKELGFITAEGLSLATLSVEQRQQLPHYVWMGPLDERTCIKCKETFGDSVIALSLDDLPEPASICLWKRACRHWWELST